MTNFRLSATDIFSPVHSDGSLNDNSIFSYGSPGGTPDFLGSKFINKFSEEDSLFESNSKTVVKENSPAFDFTSIENKLQPSVSFEKEEKFKDSYEKLKQSLDKLSHKNLSDPTSQILKSILKKSSTDIDTNTDSFNFVPKKKDSVKFITQRQDVLTVTPETVAAVKNSEKKTETSKVKKEKRPSKNKKAVSDQKESLKKHAEEKSSDKVHHNEKSYSKQIEGHKSESVKPVPLPNSNEAASSNLLSEKVVVNEETLFKKFSNAIQEKNLAEISTSSVKDKNLCACAAKSHEIDISMEFDNLRRLIMDLNNRQHKEMAKIQDMMREQNEANGYLMSVIEVLLEANKILLSKRK